MVGTGLNINLGQHMGKRKTSETRKEVIEKEKYV